LSEEFSQSNIDLLERNKENELENIRKERKKRSSNHPKSMDVSLDALAKIRQVGRLSIPKVFLNSKQHKQKYHVRDEDISDRESPIAVSPSVGKLRIPRAFSMDNLDEVDEFEDEPVCDSGGIYMAITNEVDL